MKANTNVRPKIKDILTFVNGLLENYEKEKVNDLN